MRDIAARKRIILTGSVIIEEAGFYFNRLVWMLPNGQYGYYDKRHCFGYAGENEHYSHGRKRLITSVKGWKVLPLVCYDLRFPVWSRQSPSDQQRPSPPDPVRPSDLGAGPATANPTSTDPALDDKVRRLLLELDEFMNDDFNTAKVLANIFELVPVINSLKGGQIRKDAISPATLAMMERYFTDYLENILGLKGESLGEDHKLSGVMELLIDIRRDARLRKDYATSDKIRNQLLQLGIVLKDEKDGGVSYTLA
jgi:hypothetical protein